MESSKTDKRTAIIRAALELIAEHGFHGAPAHTIADQAGVGAGTIYRYFENKDILIDEVFKYIEVKCTNFLLQDYEEEKPLPERFFHVGKQLLTYFAEYPMEFRFLEQFINSPYGVAVRRERLCGAVSTESSENFIKGIFEECKARRIVKDLPLSVLYALGIRPLVTVASDYILGFIELDDELVTLTVEACWDAVKR